MTQTEKQRTRIVSVRTSAQRPGFTLIELLVVIGFIGTISGLLVPAVDYAREASRRYETSQWMRDICFEIEQYHLNKDRYPLNLAAAHDEGYFQDYVEIVDGKLVFNNPDYYEVKWVTDTGEVRDYAEFLFSFGDEAGQRVARRIVEDLKLRLEFRPPLLVGTRTWRERTSLLYLYDCEIVTVFATPYELHSFGSLNRLTLIAIAQQLSLRPQAVAGDVFRVLGDPQIKTLTFRLFDENKDGRLTVAEFSRKSRQLANAEVNDNSDLFTVVTQPLFQFVVEDLELGPDDDHFDSEEFSLTLEDLNGDPRDLYSYENLADLTMSFKTHEGLENALLVKLQDAAEAESYGDFEARDMFLTAFQSLARAQSGKKLTVKESEILDISVEVRKGSY